MILIGLAFFLAIVLALPVDSPYQTKWFLLALLSTYWIAQKYIRPKLGVIAAIFFSYVIVNGAWFWLWEKNRYYSVQPYDQLALRYYTADAIAKLFLILIPIAIVLQNRQKALQIGGNLAALFCAVNVAMVHMQFFLSGHWCAPTNTCGGALGNPSMNSTLIVVTMPFVIDYLWGRSRWIFIALAVGAVFLSKGSVGVGMLAALACLYAVRFRMWKLLALAPISLLAGLAVFKTHMLNTGTRWQIWEFMIGNWWNNPLHYWFGTGLGNFGVFSVNLQMKFKFMDGQWWTWLHNDWLQFLFELGFIGLGLAVMVYLIALSRYIRRGEGREAIALVLFGLAMAMNYPLHTSLGCLLGAWLVLVGLLRTDENKRAEMKKECFKTTARLLRLVNN
jgi:hypothetical protein